MNTRQRPRAYGQGIVTAPKNQNQKSLAKRTAEALAVTGIVGGGIVAGALYIALYLLLLLLSLSPYILALVAAYWLYTRI